MSKDAGAFERRQRGSRRPLVGRIFNGRIQFLSGQRFIVICVPGGKVRCDRVKENIAGFILRAVARERAVGQEQQKKSRQKCFFTCSFHKSATRRLSVNSPCA